MPSESYEQLVERRKMTMWIGWASERYAGRQGINESVWR